MYKSTWSSILPNLIPEAIALFLVANGLETRTLSYICLLWLIYSIILRFVWNSAIIVHGLGHSIAIALADRQLSALNLTNILEHRSLKTVLKSLLSFNRIFIPLLTPSQLYLEVGNPTQIRIKALGGILFNLLAIIFLSLYSHNLFTQASIAANLLLAISSLSDLGALFTGVADCFYCGNFGLLAQRQLDDDDELLPARMLDLALQMGQETEIRGEQAGGGLVLGRDEDRTVFVGKKVVNKKRSNLTKSLEAAFAPLRQQAIASGIKPLDSSTMGVWHYRYATSGTAPSELETHWHEWMRAREEKVWQFSNGQWNCETKNVNHRITHNGDFDSWRIFGKDIDFISLGLWLERVLHTPNATKGDSPKIAGLMDLLVTQGMWYPSVRLAYQQAIATSIESAFDGEEPGADAPNTAPSEADLNAWAEICDRIFTLEIFFLKQFDSAQIAPSSLKSSTRLQQNLLQAFNNHSSTAKWTKAQKIALIQFALKAFFDNDLYRATQIFLSKARGSFGLVTVSTLEAAQLVLSAKGQPITIGMNREQRYTIYASEPAAIDRVLLGNPQSFRLDLDRQGEIAKVTARNIAVYCLNQKRELLPKELNSRWISLQNHPYLPYIQFSETNHSDPIARDIDSIPLVLNKIKTSWQDPTSLNRQSADYLVYLLTEKVQRFDRRQRLMFHAGLVSQIRQMSAVDLLITGEENSLWLGERFAQDLKTVFPFLNIVTLSANEVLQQLEQDFSQLHLNKDSLVLAITQSGQTFSTVQVINACDRLSNQGIIGELFILTGELSSFIDSVLGNGGLTTIVSPSSSPNDYQIENQRIFVNGSGRRTAESGTVTVAAAHQTLTELLFYLAKQMRKNFPRSHPFGMTLTQESLMVLAMMKEDFLEKNLTQIMGTDDHGQPVKSEIKKKLVRGGRYWGNHITETPLAWAIHALYILISVGWAIPFGHTLPLVKTLSGLILTNFPSGLAELLASSIAIADIGVYIFGVWLWTLLIRWVQGRQLLARMGKRTLVIGDVSWVNQLLESYVTKLFSLSYGIATIEVHGGNPQNHFLHTFGHRVVRGTLIWLGVPDGKRSKKLQAAENAVLMTGKQANGVRNINVGPEIMAIGHDRAITCKGFSAALVLNNNNNEFYFRNLALDEQKEQIEQLRESCFVAFERLLASYVFFWAMAKKVASFPLLKYEYWKSQSRTKIMTTASPVAGLDASKFSNERSSVSQQYSNYVSKG